MQTTMRLKYQLLALAVLVGYQLGAAQSALATGYLVPSFARGGENTFGEFDDPDTLTIPGVADNSYYCRAVGFSGIDILEFASTMTGPSSPDPTPVYRGTADGLNNAESAFSFIAENTGSHSISVLASTFGGGSSSSAQAILECFNTTLFGNFNTVTAANPVNFLEVKNLSTVSISARLIIKSFSGSEISRQTLTIPAGTRQDIGIHDIMGASNTFGSVQIAHTGPLGGLVANVSKYQVSGSAFNITATEPLRERVQR